MLKTCVSDLVSGYSEHPGQITCLEERLGGIISLMPMLDKSHGSDEEEGEVVFEMG